MPTWLRAVEVIKSIGVKVATPDEARQKLGLKAR